MQQLKFFICCSLAMLVLSSAQAQGGLLKKIKQKAEQTAEKVADKKIDEATGVQGNNNNNNNNNNSSGTTSSGSSQRNKASNKGGEGLVSTPPDVKANLDGAESSFKNEKYNEARYAIQQAMLGVEMEIGKKILADLPESIDGLKKDPSLDQVTSTGWGWVGLTIKREYIDGDRELAFTISNNSAWMQAINLYLGNTGYMQTSGGEQKWKQTRIQDHKAVIEYDAGSGYKLSVPLGQTSLLVYEGINFKNEQEFIKAAEAISISQIKNQLGEK
jgi:hypothetical protein